MSSRSREDCARIFDRRTVNVCKQEFRCKYTRLVCQSEGLMNAHTNRIRARALPKDRLRRGCRQR